MGFILNENQQIYWVVEIGVVDNILHAGNNKEPKKVMLGWDGLATCHFPTFTTAERDNLTPINGMIIYNSTTRTMQVRENGNWRTM